MQGGNIGLLSDHNLKVLPPQKWPPFPQWLLEETREVVVAVALRYSLEIANRAYVATVEEHLDAVNTECLVGAFPYVSAVPLKLAGAR